MGKAFEPAVAGAFHVGWKTAGGQLAHAQVIVEAIAAGAFFRAAGIAALATLEVDLFFAIHE